MKNVISRFARGGQRGELNNLHIAFCQIQESNKITLYYLCESE